MFPKVSPLDYGLLAFCLLVLLGVGVYFRRDQRTCGAFFLADRSMGWFPTGLSAMLTLLAAWPYTDVFGEAYAVGYKYLLLPLAIGCCLPLLTRVILPLYYRLGISSIYEYLERRYDVRVRCAGSAVCVFWRVWWLAGILCATGRILGVATGLSIEVGWVLVALGLASTLATVFGGMKSVIWAGVWQAALVAGGLVLIIFSAWMQLEGGPYRVAEIARAMGRADLVAGSWNATELWTSWGIFPYFFLLVLSLNIADQVTVQRYLTTRSLAEAQRSCVWSGLAATIVFSAAIYGGLVLLAFYHDHPQAMRPIWVANVNPGTHESMRDAHGIPLLAWSPQAVTPDNIAELIAQRRLLRPNTNRPFEAVNELILSNERQEQVSIPGLAQRKPPPAGLKQGEIILNERAQDELLPHFVTSQFPTGVTGLLLAALLAASMFSFGAGLTSIGTLLVTDFHGRLGIGRQRLARRLHKPVAELNAADELRVGRFFVLVVGVGVTTLALGLAHLDDPLTVLVSVTGTFAGPLLAVFLLGVFTRRTTATAALTTLVAGTLCSIGLWAVHPHDASSGLWPWSERAPGSGSLPLGFLFSLAWGCLASLILGRRKPIDQLRGLVVGIGALGVCQPEASVAIPDSFEDVEVHTARTDRAP
ncbi:MAG: sodium:solute symporter family transporter [Pirellulaceae bacterium]